MELKGRAQRIPKEGENVMSVEVVSSGAALGAEIRGVDLKKAISDSIFADIHRAFLDNEIIYFRGQALSDEDHVRFSGRFGEVRKLTNVGVADKRYPEVSVISNIRDERGDPIGSYDAGMFWHTDGAYLPKPHAATFLRAIEVPMKDGKPLGDTVYASMSAAYNALDDATRRRIEGLKAVHSVKQRLEQSITAGMAEKQYSNAHLAAPEAVHPVARPHPITGRKCLWVSQGYTVRILDIAEEESRTLIKRLSDFCVEERFQYRHRWQVHDLVMWDDSSTQHRATFDYQLPLRRLMHRTVVMPPQGGAHQTATAAAQASL
jgi:taurine dioxygenase